MVDSNHFKNHRQSLWVDRIIRRSLTLTVIFCLSIFFSIQMVRSNELPISKQIAKPHPMPEFLTQTIQKLNPNTSDYFDVIERRKFGYLIWSSFPVTVAIGDPGNDSRGERWKTQVMQAIADWQVYFPLKIVENAEIANIRIEPKRLSLKPDPKTGKLPRFRSAQAFYDVFVNEKQELAHRMTIELAPGQADGVMLGVARHELGHAIGLWGHSPNSEDVMYFSTTKAAPMISPRDLQTLYRVYQQPTQLGWKKTIEKNGSPLLFLFLFFTGSIPLLLKTF